MIPYGATARFGIAAIRNKARAFHIEKQPHAVDEHMHV
jgi:hypothetical protein